MRSSDAAEAFQQLVVRPAVVTIDLHRGHLDPAVATLPLPAAPAAALVSRAAALLTEFRRRGVPVIHVVTAYRDIDEIVSNPYWRFQADRVDSPRAAIARHNLANGPGIELMPGIAEPDDRLILTKKRYDCFVGTDLEFLLRAGKIDSILFLGVNTNSCVLATAIAASVRDFAVFVVDDGVDTMFGRDAHDAAEALIGMSFGWVLEGSLALELLDERTVAAEPASRD